MFLLVRMEMFIIMCVCVCVRILTRVDLTIRMVLNAAVVEIATYVDYYCVGQAHTIV